MKVPGRQPRFVSVLTVQIVILQAELHSESAKEPSVHQGSCVDTSTGVSTSLGLHNTHGSDEPLAKVEPAVKDGIGEQGHDVRVAYLLFPVGKCGEKTRGVLGQVMRTGEPPEPGHLVHTVQQRRGLVSCRTLIAETP